MPLYVVGGSVHAGVCAQVQAGLFDGAPKPDLREWAVAYLNDALRFTDPKHRRDARLPAELTDEELVAVSNATPPDLIETTLRAMRAEVDR